ncbi:galanin peptides [Carlito syrichta]|uniref:Galanin peptides n=1 Tax=Carlito syrichta TaxID=1868482 RepID=A0A1U7SQJ1_CARSF|nr:galanin peptides [Carlito syrichta]
MEGRLASSLVSSQLSKEIWAPPKEQRGWTLNSAEYPLGPHAMDNHRSLGDKHGLTGKRELRPGDKVQPGRADRPIPESSIVRTIIDFLDFLRLKEAGDLDSLPDPLAASSEDLGRP